jgi:SAM-dependent methyltransferase
MKLFTHLCFLTTTTLAFTAGSYAVQDPPIVAVGSSKTETTELQTQEKQEPTDWNLLQKEYSTVSKGKRDFIFPLLLEELGKIQKKDSVLDDGCGNGYDLNSILEEYKMPIEYAVGVDTSVNGIELANRRLLGSSHHIAFSVKKDPYSLDFPSEKFDVVLSTNVIPLMQNQEELEKLLNEDARVLRVGGTLLITFISDKIRSYDEKLSLGQVTSAYYKVKNFNEDRQSSDHPFQYHLTIMKVDENSIEFDDHAWNESNVVRALHKAGFKVESIQDIEDHSVNGSTLVPFQFIVAKKIM